MGGGNQLRSGQAGQIASLFIFFKERQWTN